MTHPLDSQVPNDATCVLERRTILETERLVLRELDQSNFAALCRILQDDETMRAYEGAFDVLGVDEVFSIIRDTNTASQNVACRNGMAPRCSFVKHYRGVDMPHSAYSITREEWDRLCP